MGFFYKRRKEARDQRLKREEEAVRNQDKNAIAADSWYLPQTPGGQYPFAERRRVTTLAVAQAAPNDSKDRTCPFQLLLINLFDKYFLISGTISFKLHYFGQFVF